MAIILIVEELPQLDFILSEQAWVIVQLLEEVGVGIELVVDLELLPGQVQSPLVDSVVIVDILESFGFVHVGEHLACVIGNMVDILLSQDSSAIGIVCHF